MESYDELKAEKKEIQQNVVEAKTNKCANVPGA